MTTQLEHDYRQKQEFDRLGWERSSEEDSVSTSRMLSLPQELQAVILRKEARVGDLIDVDLRKADLSDFWYLKEDGSSIRLALFLLEGARDEILDLMGGALFDASTTFHLSAGINDLIHRRLDDEFTELVSANLVNSPPLLQGLIAPSIPVNQVVAQCGTVPAGIPTFSVSSEGQLVAANTCPFSCLDESGLSPHLPRASLPLSSAELDTLSTTVKEEPKQENTPGAEDNTASIFDDPCGLTTASELHDRKLQRELLFRDSFEQARKQGFDGEPMAVLFKLLDSSSPYEHGRWMSFIRTEAISSNGHLEEAIRLLSLSMNFRSDSPYAPFWFQASEGAEALRTNILEQWKRGTLKDKLVKAGVGGLASIYDSKIDFRPDFIAVLAQVIDTRGERRTNKRISPSAYLTTVAKLSEALKTFGDLLSSDLLQGTLPHTFADPSMLPTFQRFGKLECEVAAETRSIPLAIDPRTASTLPLVIVDGELLFRDRILSRDDAWCQLYHYQEDAFEQGQARNNTSDKRQAYGKGSVVDLRGVTKEIHFIGDVQGRGDHVEAILNQKDDRGRRLWEKLRDDEAIVVFLGDLIHEERTGLTDDMYSSVVTVQNIMQLKIEFPENVYVLSGNHDVAGRMTKQGPFPALKSQTDAFAESLNFLYGGTESQFGNIKLDPRGHIELFTTITDPRLEGHPARTFFPTGSEIAWHEGFFRFFHRAFLDKGAFLALTDEVVAVHAGPAKTLTSIEELEEGIFQGRRATHLVDLTTSRYQKKENGYEETDIQRFLDSLGLPEAVLLMGHSPISDQRDRFHWQLGEKTDSQNTCRHIITVCSHDTFGTIVRPAKSSPEESVSLVSNECKIEWMPA